MTRNWNARVIRGFAILNVCVCALGLWSLIYGFTLVRTLHISGQPYLPQVFYIYTTVDLICLVLGLVSAVPLWGLRRSGLLLCNLLFGFELLFWMVGSALAIGFIDSSSQVLRGVASSIAGASGFADIGLAPQFITAYPVIALIALNVAYHKLQRMEPGAVSIARR
jgi:hypothetical protein